MRHFAGHRDAESSNIYAAFDVGQTEHVGDYYTAMTLHDRCGDQADKLEAPFTIP